MITANKVYDFVTFVSNKEAGFAPISPAAFNSVAATALDRWVERAYEAYEMNNKASDDLDELKSTLAISVPTSGQVTFPSDYRHLDNVRSKMYYTRNGQPASKIVDVNIASRNEVASYLSSEIVQPTRLNPVVVETDGVFQFYPKNIGQVNIEYIRNPITPAYNVTINTTTGQVTYNPSTSVGFEVPPYALQAIATEILALLGVRIGDQLLAQYAMQTKNGEKLP
jgi:hypothetical protein